MDINITIADSIISVLTDQNYKNIFLLNESIQKDVWNEGGNRSELMYIAKNNNYPDYIRFLVSEILFANDKNYPDKKTKEIIGPLYAKALENSTNTSTLLWLTGNQWGFMYYGDQHGLDSFGEVGQHLLVIGEDVIPSLVQLLNNSAVIYYEGSKEATLGNNLAYRVKDVSAYYIAKITDKKIYFYKNNKERDAEIERLKKQVE